MRPGDIFYQNQGKKRVLRKPQLCFMARWSGGAFTGNEKLEMKIRFGKKVQECYFEHTEFDLDLNHLSKVVNYPEI